MKTARSSQAEAGSASTSRRAQPVRQTRTNPPRSSGLSRSLNGPESGGHDHPIGIFPAITHFTDAITSLPKDLVRHFTLLKEVDAKIFAPEETLFQLVDIALKTKPPEPGAANDASSSSAPASAPMSAQNSSNGFESAMNGSLPPAPSTDEHYNSAVFSPANVPRRQLFRQTALRIQEMLVALEEKNHVISTANDALTKQNDRIDDVWPRLEQELSDEAKWGSTTHWAYPENRAQRASVAERSRRDGASAITAAAQQLAEEAAARSDARKQAVAAKKGLKNQHHDSDADADHENSKPPKNESSKKQNNSSKSRKTAESSAPVGLGITAGAPVNGNPPPKKRKPENNKEKPTNGGQPMERALSGVLGNNTSKAKNSSPRATPAPEAPASKKRKALPTINGQSKKSKNNLASTLSPSITSSPMQPNFTDAKNVGRTSPAPPASAATAVARPASARARQNSTVANADRQRPSSSSSNRPNGAVPTHDTSAQSGPRAINDTKPTKETPVPVKTETAKEDTTQEFTVAGNTTTNGSRKNSVVKADDPESKSDTAQAAPPTVTTVVTTKSGRASKPSTPALGGFPETARSRPSRGGQAGTTKRSHKKGAAQAAIAAHATNDEDVSSAQGDEDGEIDANEPRYCYCNGVSYGEMVACDADDCEKEWFHLGCVGLKSAPSSSTKWYCDNCKNRMKNGKKVNGR